MIEPSNTKEQTEKVKPKQVFIIGSKRSGTTWTLWLLANHPAIVGVFHSYLIETLKKLEKWWLEDPKFHKSVVVSKDCGDRLGGKSTTNSYERQALNNFLSNQDLYDFCTEIADNVYASSLLAKPTAVTVVESQPENIEHLELLSKIYPDAYFLHLIRDPRAVFSSWKIVAKSWGNPNLFADHPASFAKMWRKDIESARSSASQLKNYREVHYESLLDNGVQELSAIYQWLGLDSTSQLAENAIDACQINKLKKNVEMPKGFFRKGKKKGWQEELLSSEVKVIEYLLSDLMDDFQYKKIHLKDHGRPFKLIIYEVKERLFSAIKSGSLWRVLRQLKRSLQAAGN